MLRQLMLSGEPPKKLNILYGVQSRPSVAGLEHATQSWWATGGEARQEQAAKQARNRGKHVRANYRLAKPRKPIHSDGLDAGDIMTEPDRLNGAAKRVT
jgi:hypothetical protein